MKSHSDHCEFVRLWILRLMTSHIASPFANLVRQGTAHQIYNLIPDAFRRLREGPAR